MLWLAGLMGLMAVGTVAYVDLGTTEPEEEPPVPNDVDRVNMILGIGEAETINDTPDQSSASSEAAQSVVLASQSTSSGALHDGPLQRGSLDFLKGPFTPDAVEAMEHTQGDAVTMPESNHTESTSDDSTNTVIPDFEPTSDSLLFVWDDSLDDVAVPKVTVEADPDHSGHLQVWMGSEVVARVSGETELQAADISLIPLSSAIALNLVDA